MTDIVQAAMEKHGLTVTSEFVPFSKSRNAKSGDIDGKPWLSLNWKVTLHSNGKPIITTDYGSGIAHCPGYSAKTVHHLFRGHDYKNASGKPYPGTTSMYRAATPYERLEQYRKALAAAECETGYPMEYDA